jgi:hypothetical protein
VATSRTKEPKKRPMRCDVDADWSTWTCPCGASICDRGMRVAAFLGWLEKHQEHTNSKIFENITDDGARFVPKTQITRPYPKL